MLRRRRLLQSLATLGTLSALPAPLLRAAQPAALSADSLAPLEGRLTIYLGRGEGGLYGNIIAALRRRNPKLSLQVRQGPTVALANTIVAEARAGVRRADVFWAVDSGSLGLVADAGLAVPVPEILHAPLQRRFRYRHWTPISGRLRTLAYNTERLSPEQLPNTIMALADSDLSVAWAPAYGAFQSFVTAMRLLQGQEATRAWLLEIKKRATPYAGELGVVMAVARGEADVGLANHYYTLRFKAGKPRAPLALAFTRGDAGALLNASGAMLLSPDPLAADFIRYLLTREVQSYLAEQAYEIPMVTGVSPPGGLPSLSEIQPPALDLTRLSEVRPTLELMRQTGVL